MTLNPGDRGIDFATRPDSPGGITRNGAKFILRYSAGVNNSTPDRQFKLCGPTEVHDAVTAGCDFIANYEDGADTLVTATPQQMAEAGKADLDFWQERGYAKGAVLICSWDSAQPDPSAHDTVARNLDAYFTAQDDYYARGLYAGDVAISAMLDLHAIGYGWRAMSDSWSHNGDWYEPGSEWLAQSQKILSVSRAHIWQNGNRWYGADADEDVILRAGLPTQLSVTHAPPPAPTPTPHPAPPPVHHPTRETYVVQPGDTLSRIAAKFHLPGGWPYLAQLNHLANPNKIYPGQVIVVKGTIPMQRHTYTVQPGDTLSGIAHEFHTTWQRLAAINHLSNPNLIYPREVLVLN